MNIEITGRVDNVKDAVTTGTFTKREIWLTVDGGSKYPQKLSVEFNQANATKLDGIKQYDDVTITADLRGNEYNGKRYVKLSGYRISQNNISRAVEQTAESTAENKKINDDLPF